jgi:hypothetical protein
MLELDVAGSESFAAGACILYWQGLKARVYCQKVVGL